MPSPVHEEAGLRWPRSVVCFGGEDWWYHNRGHCDIQFMRQFARHGRVLYINSIVMRKFNISEGAMFWRRFIRKSRSIARGLVRLSDSFWVYSPLTAPVHHIPAVRAVNQRLLREQVRLVLRRLGMSDPLVWVNCPSGCDTALALPRSGLVYQRTDRYEAYPGIDVKRITECDRTLRRKADLTFYSSHELYRKEASDCREAAYVDHGVDYEHFAGAERNPWIPPEMRGLRHPIVGFFGGIDSHTFNMALIVRVVRKARDVTFVFVGKASVDCSPLTCLPNVLMLGQRPYEQIPHYGKCFDVCIMPFNRNAWMQVANPIKLKEYLALGKPIVATPFPEVEQYAGLVHVAENAEGFEAAIRQDLVETSAEAVAARRARVASHSWYSKTVSVLTTLQRDGTSVSRGHEPDRRRFKLKEVPRSVPGAAVCMHKY